VSAWSGWVRVCGRRERGTSLALFRIAIGAILLVNCARLLTPGILHPLFTPVAEGGFSVAAEAHPLVGLLGGHTTALTFGLAWAAVALSAALLVGFGGRITALLLLQTLVALHSLPNDLGGGYDRLLSNGVFFLVLGDGAATLSVDCRRRTGGWKSDRLVAAWPRYLMVLQLVVMYVVTGLGKTGAGWHPPYDGLYHAMLLVAYARWELGWLGDVYPLLQALTVVTWWWEVTFAVLGVWFAARQGWLGGRLERIAGRWDLRWPYLGIGVGMHLTLLVFMNVGPFSAASLAFYAAFVEPWEWPS